MKDDPPEKGGIRVISADGRTEPNRSTGALGVGIPVKSGHIRPLKIFCFIS